MTHKQLKKISRRKSYEKKRNVAKFLPSTLLTFTEPVLKSYTDKETGKVLVKKIGEKTFTKRIKNYIIARVDKQEKATKLAQERAGFSNVSNQVEQAHA